MGTIAGKQFTHFRCQSCGFYGAITTEEVAQHRSQCAYGSTVAARPLTPETISRALSEATDEQIKSEWAKRTQAMRKTKTGGRNGGRPKKVG